MATQRFKIAVPRPSTTFNMGAPDIPNEFGWEGFTLSADKHVVVNADGHIVVQSGGPLVMQSGDAMFQYGDEFVQASDSNMIMAGGEQAIVFAGGGQGASNAETHDDSGGQPGTQTYNKIDLMQFVQEQAAHVQAFLGALDATGTKLAPKTTLPTNTGGFLYDVETTAIALGHLADYTTDKDNEILRVKPDDTPDPTDLLGRARAALGKLEELVNNAVGIEGDHDIMARFNPYSGPSGVTTFCVDWVAKMTGPLSDNYFSNAAEKVFAVGEKAVAVGETWDSMAQEWQTDTWTKNVSQAAKADGAFDDDPNEDQATLQASDPPWKLPESDTGSWSLEVKVDGSDSAAGTMTVQAARAEIVLNVAAGVYNGSLVVTDGSRKAATLSGADAAGIAAALTGALGEARVSINGNAITITSTKRGSSASLALDASGVTDPMGNAPSWPTSASGSGNVADADEVTLAEFKSLGAPGGTELVDQQDTFMIRSTTQGPPSGLAIEGELASAVGIAGADSVEDPTGLEDASEKQGAIFGTPENLANKLIAPLVETVNVATAACETVEAGVDAASALVSINNPGDDPPLGLFAQGGITLATPDRYFNTASKGFYFIADGGNGSLGKKMVPAMLRVQDAWGKITSLDFSQDDPGPPSLGFLVRSDSDVDLKGRHYAVLSAVASSHSLARVESGHATDITAVNKVAVGPRAAGSSLEAFGDTIHLGMRTDDKDGVAIRDDEYLRPFGNNAVEEKPATATTPAVAAKPATAKVWPKDDVQQATQKVAVAADTEVTIEAGDFLVHVSGGAGVTIGVRKVAAPAKRAVAGAAGPPVVAATSAERAQRTIDTEQPHVKLTAAEMTIYRKDGDPAAQFHKDGGIHLVGPDGEAQLDIGKVSAQLRNLASQRDSAAAELATAIKERDEARTKHADASAAHDTAKDVAARTKTALDTAKRNHAATKPAQLVLAQRWTQEATQIAKLTAELATADADVVTKKGLMDTAKATFDAAKLKIAPATAKSTAAAKAMAPVSKYTKLTGGTASVECANDLTLEGDKFACKVKGAVKVTGAQIKIG